jgi:citrate synthase
MNNLKEIYQKNLQDNYIDPSLYPRYRVKAGLRNENGTGVKVGLTKICDVIGYRMIHGHKHNEDGKLIYRGYDIADLVRMKNEAGNLDGYERTAFLLIFGKLPDQDELACFKKALKEDIHTDFINANYHTSNLLNAMQIEVLKLYGEDENPDNDNLEERMLKGISILASMPLFVFSNYRQQKFDHYPAPEKSLAENILIMARGNENYTKAEASMMDSLLMIHADHGGGNNSTFANVVISSTGTDIYSCISAAIGSLKGPRHGGAAFKTPEQYQAILNEAGITNDEKVLSDIAYRILKKQFNDNAGLIYGIGHAVYTKSDPRAVLLKQACKTLAQEKGMSDEFEMLSVFEQEACKAVHNVKGTDACANVDFYSGFAYRMLGIEPSLFTPLFAIARTAGWIAHHLENRQSNRKLIRPANIYVGERYYDHEDEEEAV